MGVAGDEERWVTTLAKLVDWALWMEVCLVYYDFLLGPQCFLGLNGGRGEGG